MVWWKEYILSIIGCVLFCGILSNLISDLRSQKLIRLISGTLLSIVILGQLPSIDITDSFRFEMEQFSPEEYIDLGKQAAQKEQERCIKEACKSYISNKANEQGRMITTEVYLDDQMRPFRAEMYGRVDPELQSELEAVLENDLGITKENQLWIWNQENDNSYPT